MLKVFNVIGVIVLLLLLRKLIWCLRWLWCWKHDRETPPPIGWLPSRDGGRFDAHVQKFDGETVVKKGRWNWTENTVPWKELVTT